MIVSGIGPSPVMTLVVFLDLGYSQGLDLGAGMLVVNLV